MKVITIIMTFLLLACNCAASSNEWKRNDLYSDGSKSAKTGDCFSAISQLFAFKEFNKSMLQQYPETNKAIDDAINKCRNTILASRKVEYKFIPIEKKCDCNEKTSGSTGAVSFSGMNEIPTVSYRIIKKKGNPNGLEVPEYDVLFDIETSRSKVSYPLIPSIFDDGKFQPYGATINNTGAVFSIDYEARFAAEMLQKYIQSHKSKIDTYKIDPIKLLNKNNLDNGIIQFKPEFNE